MKTLSLHIDNTHIDVRSGTSQKTGKDYRIVTQRGMLELPNGERRSVEIKVQEGKPLAVGTYNPLDTGWYMDKFNEPKLSLYGDKWQLEVSATRPALKTA